MSIALVIQVQRVKSHLGDPLEGSSKAACESCSQPVWVAAPTREVVREIVAHGGEVKAYCEECKPANVVAYSPDPEARP